MAAFGPLVCDLDCRFLAGSGHRSVACGMPLTTTVHDCDQGQSLTWIARFIPTLEAEDLFSIGYCGYL